MSETGPNLPTKEVRLWKNSASRKKSENYKPMTPNFCPCKDPDTDKKCGKYMEHWDQMFYEQYGMCENCFKKHNDHIEGLEKKVDELKNTEGD